MTNARDLFHRVMRFACPGYTLTTLGGIWPSCFERWRAEGMPPELVHMPALLAHFQLTPHVWAKPRAELLVFPPFPRTVVRQTDRTVTYVNGMGVTCTDFKKDAYKSMPHFEDYPIKGRRDWEAFRSRLAWTPERVGEPWRLQVEELRQTDAPVILAFNRAASLYGSLRDLVGMERLSLLLYDDPGLVTEMMDAMVELFLGLADRLLADYVPDAVCMWEDMAYKSGSLLGLEHVRRLMLPRYRVMTAKLRQHAVPYIFLDSDGRIDDLIPVWLEAGIDGVVPLEVQSGMDVDRLRREYPRLLMIGGVDKKALARGPAAIDAEIAKIRRTIATGGYVPFFDHGLPHDVCWDDFVYFARQLQTLSPPAGPDGQAGGTTPPG